MVAPINPGHPLASSVPDNVASSIASFCELAPGIPSTQQLLDDMLETMETDAICARTTDVPGFARIEAYACKVARKAQGGPVTTELQAKVIFEAGAINDAPPHYQLEYEHPTTAGEKRFPNNRDGMKGALEFMQTTVHNLKRRGLCGQCLAMARPAKRLRIGGSGLCSACLLKRAVF